MSSPHPQQESQSESGTGTGAGGGLGLYVYVCVCVRGCIWSVYLSSLCTVNSSRYSLAAWNSQIFHELFLKAASLQVVGRQEVGKSENWIWLADFADDRRNQGGFSAPCPCTLGATKRASPPLATAVSRWWESGALGGSGGALGGERVDERGKNRGGAEAERASDSEKPQSCWENKWLEGNLHIRSIIEEGFVMHTVLGARNGWQRKVFRWEDEVSRSTIRRWRWGRNGVKEECDLSGVGSKWQMLLLWPRGSFH